MQTCSKCQKQSPDLASICTSCQADLKEWSTSAVALKKYQENPRVKYVRVTTSDTCCPACRKTEGAYPKEDPPHIPIEGCSHPQGCRCFYQPFLDDIYP